jgi:hypothetical protein
MHALAPVARRCQFLAHILLQLALVEVAQGGGIALQLLDDSRRLRLDALLLRLQVGKLGEQPVGRAVIVNVELGALCLDERGAARDVRAASVALVPFWPIGNVGNVGNTFAPSGAEALGIIK